MKKITIQLIKYYQKILSPDQGIFKYIFGKHPTCSMYPTCSSYMIEAIEKYGIFSGICRGILRIFRCHPYQKKLIDLP